ncbi:YicC/YloC family endoribonuclease [Rhabdochromatium marinum]|uniref:YicC/YloC family endoribonuclease n=1 Tax=Rhabdochromatium marinum TaxID=48729 RepID=UPI0019039704|nr:YicC/YloC family endoribonuclease [Rhabdochromatium marinum]MBK1650073.1 YicC family protein [Rhabdochromatium marinum]
MIKSMTAFARHQARGVWGELSWEIRSVNHRFLEPHLRLPEELRGLDPSVRERLRAHVQRGKIDCTLRWESTSGTSPELHINAALLTQVLGAADRIGSRLGASQPPAVMDLLRWPGMLEEPAPDLDTLNAAALTALDETLHELIAARAREGARLQRLIEQRCERLAELIAEVRTRMPQLLDEMRTRISSRLAEIRGELDPTRIEQEMVLLAQRCDVDEEMDRLEGHIDEVRKTLTTADPVGRRLDFLMQELNREANTLGSKSADAPLTRIAVEMKVLIEQMREQVQNLE